MKSLGEIKDDVLNFTMRKSQACYGVPKQEILKEENIPNIILKFKLKEDGRVY